MQRKTIGFLHFIFNATFYGTQVKIAMSSSCSYDCSAPDPPFVPFDNDITGVGVVTNYIATAGIAVLIILIYYFTVYQPSQDPFERVDQSGFPFRPNPVDEIFLRGLRRGPTYVLRRILRSRQISPRAGARLEKIFVKVGCNEVSSRPSYCI
jgi:hypothetical protein